jgi:uncharacterized membrane protein HdeD (DUF308 family)
VFLNKQKWKYGHLPKTANARALLLNGIARLVIGGFIKVFPRWLRGFFVVVGLLTIAVSVFVFVSPGFGFFALVLMLSFTFLFNGIARIVQGITGTQEKELQH